MATQSDREIELSQTNRGVGGVCVGVIPRVQPKLSRVHDLEAVASFRGCIQSSEKNTGVPGGPFSSVGERDSRPVCRTAKPASAGGPRTSYGERMPLFTVVVVECLSPSDTHKTDSIHNIEPPGKQVKH